jgi:two-component system OmpR family response regulator
MASHPQFATAHAPDVFPSQIAIDSAVVAFPRSIRSDQAASPTGHQSMVEHSRSVRVLVVDDDPAFQDMVATYLDEHNMRVTRASSRHAAVPQLTMDQPSLVMLDLRLGQENGLDLLREIRSRSDVPVITTGHGCSEIDCVVGLELGADDHIAKPFGLRELLARIRAILRRRESRRAGPQRRSERNHYRFGLWQLDQRTRRLTAANGERVTVTKGEFTLLIAFLNAPLRPLTREHLLQATRVHENVFDRSIDVQVLRLRRKLEIDPSAPRVIRTERGVGYVFDMPVERADTNARKF